MKLHLPASRVGCSTVIDQSLNFQVVVSTSRGSLTLSKLTYAVYDQVTVSFTVPKSRADSSVWIGVYEVGASDGDYSYWSYTGKKASGELTFKIKKAGTYEFRLFYDRDSNEVATSRRITVQ